VADSTVVAALTFLHIASAMGWLGGAMLFLSAVGPGARTFTPPASLEFLTKVGLKLLRFFAGVSTATIAFGLALLFATFGADYAVWPWYIEVGLTMGLIAYLMALLVTIPTFRKLDKMAQEVMSKPPGPPIPDFPKLLKRANMAAMLVMTLVFMVRREIFA
jgi:hypothetical protein